MLMFAYVGGGGLRGHAYVIHGCSLRDCIPEKHNRFYYLQPKKTFTGIQNQVSNSLVNTNLFYANLTNTQFEKVPIFHLRHTMKLASSENMMSD